MFKIYIRDIAPDTTENKIDNVLQVTLELTDQAKYNW